MAAHRLSTELAVSRTPTTGPGSGLCSRSINSGSRVCAGNQHSLEVDQEWTSSEFVHGLACASNHLPSRQML